MSSVSETALGTIHPRLACADHSELVRIDSTLIRAGLARLLVDAGLEVVAQLGNAEELLVHIESDPPDVAVVDIRMPPTHTDEDLIATARIRDARPKVGVLLLSQFVDIANAMKLVRDGSSGVGYLLKDRVADVPEFVDVIRRVAAGESVVDPALVSELVDTPVPDDPLAKLTAREREVLALLAQGRADRGIASSLFVSRKTVEAHIRNIFTKLDLPLAASEIAEFTPCSCSFWTEAGRDRLEQQMFAFVGGQSVTLLRTPLPMS